MQSVQNAAARIVTGMRRTEHLCSFTDSATGDIQAGNSGAQNALMAVLRSSLDGRVLSLLSAQASIDVQE